jgi:neutral ceramidase
MSAKAQSLLAGTGRRCINPPPNIAHGGWGAQKHEQAEGIDMDLCVTALALSDGATTAIILDVDIQILTNQVADSIRSAVTKATGVPAQNIRASATHTHSGPVPYKSWIEKGYELVGPWFERVYSWCAEAAGEAVKNLQPVTIRAGRGECHINVNRRAITSRGERFLGQNRDGACDHEVIVVKVDASNRTTFATVVNYACHPTIMGPANRLITPDYPGAMKRVVEQAIGGKCLFLLGAAGDQGPVHGFQGDVNVYRNLGAILGHEVVQIALGLNWIPSSEKLREVVPSGAPLGMYDQQFAALTGLPLRVIDKEIAVPLREALPDRKNAAQKLQQWKEKLKAAREKQDAAITKAIFMARRADIELRMAEDFGGRTDAGVRTQFITFGDVALVSCNIEPFCKIGLAIKRQSPFPFTLVSGYSNGRMAYMPTAEEWARGGYEVENSPFGQGAAEVLQREIIATLRELRSRA